MTDRRAFKVSGSTVRMQEQRIFGPPLVVVVCSQGSHEIAILERRYAHQAKFLSETEDRDATVVQHLDVDAEPDATEVLHVWCRRCRAWRVVHVAELLAEARHATRARPRVLRARPAA